MSPSVFVNSSTFGDIAFKSPVNIGRTMKKAKYIAGTAYAKVFNLNAAKARPHIKSPSPLKRALAESTVFFMSFGSMLSDFKMPLQKSIRPEAKYIIAGKRISKEAIPKKIKPTTIAAVGPPKRSIAAPAPIATRDAAAKPT